MFCDCIQPDCSTEKIRRARKTHKCCECGRPINPKDRYHHIKGVWEGEIGDYKTCIHCVRVRRVVYNLAAKNDDCGPCLGGLYEWIQEEFWDAHAEEND